MTSSLVGSEMCIRDRHPVRPRSRAPSVGADVIQPSAIPLRRMKRQPQSCLLYTSDAADNM
eukprot:3413018-Prorocentrum_lima.AAC.1